MALSTEFMCFRNSSLCDWSCITQLSSTYLLQSLGGCTAVVKALASNDIREPHNVTQHQCNIKKKKKKKKKNLIAQ